MQRPDAMRGRRQDGGERERIPTSRSRPSTLQRHVVRNAGVAFAVPVPRWLNPICIGAEHRDRALLQSIVADGGENTSGGTIDGDQRDLLTAFVLNASLWGDILPPRECAP